MTDVETPREGNRGAVIMVAVLAVAVVVGAIVFVVTRPSDEDKVRDTVNRYYDAAGTKDWASACAVFQSLLPKNCARFAAVSGPNPQIARRASIEKVIIDGDRAYAEIEFGDPSDVGEAKLEFKDDQWWVVHDPLGGV